MITPEKKKQLRQLMGQISTPDQVEADAVSNFTRTLVDVKKRLDQSISEKTSESSRGIKVLSEGFGKLEQDLEKAKGGSKAHVVILAKEIKKTKGLINAFLASDAAEKKSLKKTLEDLQKDIDGIIWKGPNQSNGMHAGTTPNITVSSTAPLNPNEGDLWVDSS